MRIVVLVPDRGDRPEFMAQCRKLIERQTLQPVHVEVVDYAPVNDDPDITPRYKFGYEKISKEIECDLIAFMENDDWYHRDYLKLHSEKWWECGRPIIFGTNFTVYYHLKLQRYFTMYHEQRSSAMNTFMRPNIPGIDWGLMHNPYTDMQLWEQLYKKGGAVWKPPVLSVGMKHGVGKFGGFCHVDMLERYENADGGFLMNTIGVEDRESYDFYMKFKSE